MVKYGDGLAIFFATHVLAEFFYKILFSWKNLKYSLENCFNYASDQRATMNWKLQEISSNNSNCAHSQNCHPDIDININNK